MRVSVPSRELLEIRVCIKSKLWPQFTKGSPWRSNCLLLDKLILGTLSPPYSSISFGGKVRTTHVSCSSHLNENLICPFIKLHPYSWCTGAPRIHSRIFCSFIPPGTRVKDYSEVQAKPQNVTTRASFSGLPYLRLPCFLASRPYHPEHHWLHQGRRRGYTGIISD